MVAVLYLLAGLSGASAQQPDAELVAAVRAYEAAIVAGDRPTLSDLLLDDFEITSGDGQTRNKTAELADLFADG